MLSLNFVTTRFYQADADFPHYTDLLFHDGVLYATSYYDGRVEAWGVANNTLTRFSTRDHDRVAGAGAIATLTALEVDGQTQLLTGGGGTGVLSRYELNGSGAVTGRVGLGYGGNWGGDMGDMVSTVLADGSTAVYGALENASGIGLARIGASGQLQGNWLPVDQGHVTDLALATIGQSRYLFSTDAATEGVTSWKVQSNGALQQVVTLGAQDNLWIAAPTVLETAQVGDRTYLVLGAAESGSLSVIEVNAIGGLRVVDHVLDSRFTNFGNIQALKTLSYGDFTYVIAGGGEGGLSVFLLLPDGHLLEQGSTADSAAAGLADISAIEARVSGYGFDVFATSASELGITRLRYNLGADGVLIEATEQGGALTGSGRMDLLQGGSGDDDIAGNGGPDVLIDGAGRDTMSGGAGADTFVLVRDGALDRITDFDPTQDRIDLSQWPMLRSVGQLQVTAIAGGFRLTYGDEVLEVLSDDWGGMTPQTLPQNVLIGLDRIAIDLELALSNQTDDPAPYVVTGTAQGERLVGYNSTSHLHGGGGDDELYGGAGADRLYGNGGDDLIVSGGGAADEIYGGPGDDTIYIGSIWDLDLI